MKVQTSRRWSRASRVARHFLRRWVQHIVKKTDGVPLYVEELTKVILESGLLREETDRYDLTGRCRPSRSRPPWTNSSRPGLTGCRSCAGSPNSAPCSDANLSTKCSRPLRRWDEARLQEGFLSQLVEAELLYQRGYTTTSNVHIQARSHTGRGLSVAAQRTRQQCHRQVADIWNHGFRRQWKPSRSYWLTTTPRRIPRRQRSSTG